MNTTPQMKEIEEKEGRPIRAVLADLFAEHGTQSQVAEALGITQSTVTYWLMRLGLEQRTILVDPADTTFQDALAGLNVARERLAFVEPRLSHDGLGRSELAKVQHTLTVTAAALERLHQVLGLAQPQPVGEQP